MMARLFTPIFAAFFALCILQTQANAQSLPRFEETMLNDWDDVLDPAQEAEMRAKISALREDTGIELVVVTLPSRTPFGWDKLEPFATALFNDWGVGDADRNDGIMVLLLREDREMRIELGDGYSTGYNRVAQSLVDTDFLPHFIAGDFPKGLILGTDAVIAEIARPMASGKDIPSLSAGDRLGIVLGYVFAGLALVGTLAAFFGRAIMTRVRRCPSCGRRTLHQTRETTIPATRKSKGQGERHTTCDNCDYSLTTSYSIARRGSSSSSGGSFGGGSSSGGGASGRW